MKAFWKEHRFYLLILLMLGIGIMWFTGAHTHNLGHDMGFHVKNIENLASYLDFSKGHFFVPDISENIGSNLGYGLYLFYPSLPHLLYAYFYKFTSLFSIDILTSILLLTIFLTLISTFFMYLLSYKLSQNKRVAFLTGLIFLLFPYRLSNYFIRYALNESLLFVFIPLVLLGLYEWKHRHFTSFFFYFTIGYIGMLYSHLMMSFYFTLLLLPFVFYFRKEWVQKEYGIPFLKAILVVTIFASPILLSFFEHYQGQYLVYLPNYMTSPALVLYNVMHPSSYFCLNTDDWAIQSYIPFLVILSWIASVVYFFKRKKEGDIYLCLLISSLICVVMTTGLFPWRGVPSLFMMIQFPWRLLTFLLIFVSLWAPIWIERFAKKQAYIVLFFTVFLLLGSMPLLFQIRDRSYSIDQNPLLLEQATGNMGEYYPTELYRAPATYYHEREEQGLVVTDLKGKAEVRELTTDFPNLSFEVKKVGEAKVEFPRIYYKGYELHKDGKKYPVSRSSNGLIEVTIEEEGIYTLVYTKTLLKRGVILFKYSFLVGMLLWWIYKKVGKKRKC